MARIPPPEVDGEREVFEGHAYARTAVAKEGRGRHVRSRGQGGGFKIRSNRSSTLVQLLSCIVSLSSHGWGRAMCTGEKKGFLPRFGEQRC